MPSQRPPHSTRFLIWLLPAFILVVCLLNSRSGKPEPTRAPDKELSANSQRSKSAYLPPQQATASQLSLSKNTVQRAENETLLYVPAKPLVRDTIPNSVFAGEIFSRKAKTDGPLTFSNETLSAIETNFTPQTVEDFLASTASAVRLPLNANEEVVALIDNVLTRDSSTVSLFGSLAYEPDSQVHLVFHDGAVFGNISRLGREEFYEITSAGDGDIAIREIDPTQLGACNGAEVLGDAIDLSQLEEDGNNDSAPAVEEEAEDEFFETDLTVIDLVVGYGRQAAENAGGTSAIEAQILAAVDQVNLAFSNSALPLEAFLAGTIQDPDYQFPGRNPDGATLGSADELGDLNDSNDGSLDAVTDLQRLVGADHATFIVRNGEGGAAGVAFINGDSGIVALTSLTASAATFTHELGHSLGCRHAWGDDDNSLDRTLAGYGWRFVTESGQNRRTIMASNRSPRITRLPYFSNPTVQVDGANTGAVRGFDGTDDPTVDQSLVEGGGTGDRGAGFDGSNDRLGADNAGQITLAMTQFANRRTRAAPLPQGTLQLFQVESEAVLSDDDAFISFNSASDPVTMNFVVTNISGSNLLDRLELSITGPDASLFSVTSLSQIELGIGESTNFAVTYTPSNSAIRSATLEVRSSAINAPFYTVDLSGALRRPFLSDGLEDAALTGPFIDSTGNEFDFPMDRGEGSTRTTRTGPSGPFEGSFYRYTEASAGGGPSRDGQLAIETTLDLSQQVGTLFQFRYHMYGEDTGSLHLDVIANGSTFESLWQRSGEQQQSSEAPYSLAQVDLSAFEGESNVVVRLRGVLEGGTRSDMAIDAIEVSSALLLSPYELYLADLDFPTGSAQIAGLRPLDDFNRDGIANLLHFTSGGNLVTGEGPALLSTDNLEANGSVTFPLLNSLSGVDAGIEVSHDLQVWDRISLDGLEQSSEGNFSFFTFEIPSNETNLFVRYFAEEEEP